MLPPGSVVELGAGNGRRTRQLRQSGRTVLSLEVEGGPYQDQAAPGLVLYDGVHIPARTRSSMLSSAATCSSTWSTSRGCCPNALECSLRTAWQSTSCRPRPGGCSRSSPAIWGFLPPHDVASGVSRSRASRTMDRPRCSARGEEALPPLKRLLVPRAHGIRGNALTEIWHFSRPAWRRRFAASGWEIVRLIPGELAFSGNHVLRSRLSLTGRRRLARLTGASSRIIVCRPLVRPVGRRSS